MENQVQEMHQSLPVREIGVIINDIQYYWRLGQLLADVLEADLLEVAVEIPKEKKQKERKVG